MPGGGREVQQGVRALGRAVWVDGLDRAPFPVGAGEMKEAVACPLSWVATNLG